MKDTTAYTVTIKLEVANRTTVFLIRRSEVRVLPGTPLLARAPTAQNGRSRVFSFLCRTLASVVRSLRSDAVRRHRRRPAPVHAVLQQGADPPESRSRGQEVSGIEPGGRPRTWRAR